MPTTSVVLKSRTTCSLAFATALACTAAVTAEAQPIKSDDRRAQRHLHRNQW